MADAKEHGSEILAAIIPNRPDLLDKAQRYLTPDHFVDQAQQRLYKLLCRYSEATGSVLPKKYLDDLVSKKTENAAYLILRETYISAQQQSVHDGEFTWSVQRLRELHATRLTDEALVAAREILHSPEEEDGLTRHQAARDHLTQALLDVERGLQLADSPEGMLNDESDDMLADYQERKKANEEGSSKGVLFGIESLDKKTGGMQPGELIISAAYSSEGKTTLTVQAAWSAAVEQGKNVVFFSTETLRAQIRRKLIARHSKHPKFGLAHGLNSRHIKDGTLSAEEEEKLVEVVKDFDGNDEYGRIYIVQVPRGSTVGSLEARLRRIQTMFNVDLVIMDYLALLTPERGRNSSREELSDIMKEAKKVATSFDDGRGVPFLSPWQINREGRASAERVQMYTSRDLAETAEATNSADMIVTILAPLDNSERIAQLLMQVLKNRDGETANSLRVEVDYATAYFRSVSATAMMGDSSGILGL